VKSAAPLARILADPVAALSLDPADWPALLSIARLERLEGSLAYRLAGLPLPPSISQCLETIRTAAAVAQQQALWEVEMVRRALALVGLSPILLKGSAFAFAGLPPAPGRHVGDLDLLLPRDSLDLAERALLDVGYDWIKDDPYTQAYYRNWMHELPPLAHSERGSMIDVHHSILPLTARRTPDAAALVRDSMTIADGLRILAPADMIVHATAHLFADGDLSGGLRNLWDIDRLLRLFGTDRDFWLLLRERAMLHQMREPVALALRLTNRLFATPVEPRLAGNDRMRDTVFVRCLLARDGWGCPTRPFTRLGFYVRSHWMRMPPLLLARHLWTKGRMRRKAA
jgi:hypothetical protein